MGAQKQPLPHCSCERTRSCVDHLLASHIAGVMVNNAGGAMATQTLVNLTPAAFIACRADTLDMAIAGQRACLGVYAVVVADVCPRMQSMSVTHHTLKVRLVL